MSAIAPDGALFRGGIMTVEENAKLNKTELTPPCLGKALRRGTLAKFESFLRLKNSGMNPLINEGTIKQVKKVA